MIAKSGLLIIAAIGLALAGACTQMVFNTIPQDFDAILAEYKAWDTLQPEPHAVGAYIWALCRMPTEEEQAFVDSEHGQYFLWDFINDAGQNALENNANTFPVGTVIVKEKYGFDESRETPDALGIMVKRERGFNPEGGDWEFMYWEEGDQLYRGPEETYHCQGCHAEAERDFVFYGEEWGI